MKAQVWTNDEDWIIARSAKEAFEFAAKHYDLDKDEIGEPDDWRALDGLKRLKIWEGMPGQNEQELSCREWARRANEIPYFLASVNY